MISCNHLSLGGDNKAKLARMAEVLLERFSQVGDTEPPSAVEMAELDALTLALFELTQAREAGRVAWCTVARLPALHSHILLSNSIPQLRSHRHRARALAPARHTHGSLRHRTLRVCGCLGRWYADLLIFFSCFLLPSPR